MTFLKKFLTLYLFTMSLISVSQNMPQGINFQAIARDTNNIIIKNSPISIKIQIYEDTALFTNLKWEEIHNIVTNNFGLFNLIIGKGIPTANSTVNSISDINWGNAKHLMIIGIDFSGGMNYINIDTTLFYPVPYALYALNAGKIIDTLSIFQLLDVDSTSLDSGKFLMWNGSKWIPEYIPFNDSVTFSLNSNYSIYSDTSNFAFDCINNNDYWSIKGNSNIIPDSNFIGTIDSTDFVIKTNNSERLRILANGRIGIGTSNPLASLHISGNDGFLATGTFGSGTLTAPSGSGTRMFWYPKKAAFRAGYVNTTFSNYWNDFNIGNYSVALGNTTKASGNNSFAACHGAQATGTNSVAMGYGALASGFASIAMGAQTSSRGYASVAMGRASQATDTAAIALGYWNQANAKAAISFGYFTLANAPYTVAMGYYSNANKKGSFVFGDASTTNYITPTAENQFIVRAAGGTYFYSSSNLSSGVFLAPGSGSWSNVSDIKKKKNIKLLNYEKILTKFDNLNIYTWNYKSQPDTIIHIGPMAQDLYNLYGFGESDSTINTIDIAGINLAVSKALFNRIKTLEYKANKIKELEKQIRKLKKERDLLLKKITLFEQEMQSD